MAAPNGKQLVPIIQYYTKGDAKPYDFQSPETTQIHYKYGFAPNEPVDPSKTLVAYRLQPDGWEATRTYPPFTLIPDGLTSFSQSLSPNDKPYIWFWYQMP